MSKIKLIPNYDELPIKEQVKHLVVKLIDDWERFKMVRGEIWWKITEQEERYIKLSPSFWEKFKRSF